MKFKPVLGSELSGSIGGITASHNAGGAYFRNRVIPTNPNSVQQQAIRSTVGQLTSLWNNTLTGAQRAAWDLYAANVPLLDALGEPINVSGLNMYVRSNVSRIQATFGRIDAAPGVFNLGDFTAVTVSALSEGTQAFDVNFTAGDDWVTDDGGIMVQYCSRPQNPSINYFKGPYRLCGAIVGNSGAPPASPVSTNAAFPFVLGQIVFFRFAVSRSDGRYSLSQRIFQTAVA